MKKQLFNFLSFLSLFLLVFLFVQSCKSKKDYAQLFNACNLKEQINKIKFHYNIEYGNWDYVDIKEKVKTLDIKYCISQIAGVRFQNNACKCMLPDHKDNTASFHVYPNTHSFYCFWCCRWGSLVDFFMHMNKMSKKDAMMTVSKM